MATIQREQLFNLADTNPATLGAVDQITASRLTYPDARATQEDLRRQGIHQVDYAILGLGQPLQISSADYRYLVTQQMGSYLRICEKLAQGFPKNRLLQTYFDKVLLQYENPAIRQLTLTYPVSSLLGAQFASDIILGVPISDLDATTGYKTLEVNFGAVGGIGEGAKAQASMGDAGFPVSSTEMMLHLLHGLDRYYYQACNQLGIQSMLGDRSIVLVENDGWYAGPVCMAEALNSLGQPISVVPREALRYDSITNTLVCTTGKTQVKKVDQLFLNFGYVEDVAKPASDKTAEDLYGDITSAINNRAVVAESSVFTQVVLGSKATQALIEDLMRHPQSQIVRSLDISSLDLANIRDMFPETHQWGPTYFTEKGVNRLRIREHVSSGTLVVKETCGGVYGGRGVYMFESGDSKEFQRFWGGIKYLTFDRLLRFQNEVGSLALRRFLKLSLTGFECQGNLIDHLEIQQPGYTKGKDGERRIGYFYDILRSKQLPQPSEKFPEGIKTILQTHYRCNEEEIERFIRLHQRLNPTDLQDTSQALTKSDIEGALNDTAFFIRRFLDGPGGGKGASAIELQKRLTERLASQIFLPAVVQQKICSSYIKQGNPIEFRVAGTVGGSADDMRVLLTAVRKGDENEPSKIMYPVQVVE